MKLGVPAFTLLSALALISCQNNPPVPQADVKPEAEKKSESGKHQGQLARRESEPARRPAGAELPAGTTIEVRLASSLSTKQNRAGDPFQATLEFPVSINGREVLPGGTPFTGHVTTSDASGRMSGRAVLGITLDSFEIHGVRHNIQTTLDTKTSDSHKKRNIEMIGGGAGLGALIGAIAGGGKGAAIGAGAGAAAGTAGEIATGKKNVEIPAETLFTFRLKAPAELR